MGVSVWAFIRAAAKVEERTTFEIRMQAFKNLQQLSFSYFDNTPTGWVMARMTSDARRLANIISWGLVDFLWGFLLMIGILIISFFINWRLALIMTALLPIFIVIAILYRKKILKEHREVRKINSHITASYNESFMAANTTKTLVLEDDNAQEFNDLAEKYKRRAIRAAFFSSLFWPTILFLGYIGVAIVTYVGGKMVLNDPLGILFTTGTLYLFVDYAIKFFDPVMIVARVLTDLQQAQASAERVISLIETPSDIVDTPEVVEKYGTLFEHKKENWEPIEGAITFDNVSFRYKNTDNNVLTNFNLEIKAGQMVAFVGETGSGKSTIVNLISRFYEPTEGRILIDGKDYRERSISWLHANLGYVLQTPQLFSTTIKENIRYGKLDATDEEVIAAAKLANAHNFILEQENGYDTYIGEGGNKLSTGQKQLISFARAVIANPRILVLDEATSSIDTENEKTILEAMQTVLKGRTSLVVAHRLSTIVNADKIVVLRNGVVVEEGTHRELLNAKGYYFELYRNQFMQELEQKLIQDI
jgi:ATP-binding cassette subfamily B protein